MTAAAAGGLSLLAKAAPLAAQGRDLSLELEIDGRKLVFRQSEARNMGDFVGPAYVQHCFMAVRADMPLTVFFRPDKGTDRVEVVVELGRLFGAANAAAANLGAYRATIRRGDAVLATVEVPKHNWFGRWRWQSAPRSIRVNGPDLAAAGLIPPYKSGAVRTRGGSAHTASYTIMGTAGLATYMPTTGERGEIGLLTESQAAFVVGGGEAARASMTAQAEASGSIPWHVRDENTGAPISFDRHPNVTWRDVKRPSTGWRIDTAHQPTLTYLPYLLTGDPYYLEELQFACAWNFGGNSPQYRNYKDCVLGAYPYSDVGQSRAYAWSIRTLAYVAKATPDSVPSWLLPRAYWKTKLDANRAWFTTRFVNNPKPMYQVFRSTSSPWYIPTTKNYPTKTTIDPWQDHFQGAVFEQILRLGFGEWKQIADWKSGLVLALTNGKSGWNRNTGTPYRLKLRADDDDPWAESFAAAWALNKPLLGDPQSYTPSDVTYDIYARGYLAMLRARGVPGAAESFAWLDGVLASRGAGMPYRWSLG